MILYTNDIFFINNVEIVYKVRFGYVFRDFSLNIRKCNVIFEYISEKYN